MRCDGVEIGSPSYERGEGDETASWEDVRKLVAGIRWLVPGWVPYGMATGIIAEPKVGKSAFALGALVRPIITGCNWFTGHLGSEPGYVVWCDTEGSAAINIHRAGEWGLPVDRVRVPFPDDPLRAIDLDNADHMGRIESVVSYYRARLVVVDSFRGAHGGDENNSKIARALQSLTTIAERTKAAVCIIHHTRKLVADEEMTANSGRGSNAFLAMVRCQLGIDRPEGPKAEWRRVQVLGENLGIAPSPVGFRFAKGGLEFGQAPERPRKEKETRRDQAEDWLREHMTPGKWYPAGKLLKEADQLGGYSANAIQRAREALGIVKPRHVRKVAAGWEWQLPVPGESKAPEQQTMATRPNT
ncbi:MAG: AAA family ATPase [Thermoguttaceae bacterium]|jgi:hypothetical protein